MAAKRGGGRIKTVVYLDVLLLTNFLTAYLLLLAAGALSGQRAPFARMLAGSVLAALSALILFAPEQPYPVQVAYKAATALGITAAAFGWRSRRRLVTAACWYAALNIALDPVFIFALNMGVRGAALATVLSQGLSCAWVLVFLCGKKAFLRLRRENLFVSPKLILPCVALGLATFTMQASESVISVCFNASLLKYGGDIAVGAMTILTSVMQFAMLPLQGIGQGAQPITSYNFGAKNTDRVRETFHLLLKVCLIYSVSLWLLIELFPGLFARIFTPDAELIAFTARVLRIYCAGLFLFGIQIACQMTFVSIGSAVCSIIVAVLRKFVLLLPLIYLLPALLPDQTTAVYLAEPVADVIAVTCTAILFATQFRKALHKLGANA